MSRFLCILFLVMPLLNSCGGYHPINQNNPLQQYGISTVAIPMFINQTAFADISGPMTKEIARVLHSYPGIRVYAGEYVQADAILIGVIKSRDKVNDVVLASTKRFTTDRLKESIGPRKEFYIPSASSYQLQLELTLIKDPSVGDKELIHSDLKKYLSRHPKVIFNEVMELSGSYDRVIMPNTKPDDGGTVNYSQNVALFKKSIENLSVNAALNFKEVILNAF